MFAENRQSTTDFFPRDWLGFLTGLFIEDAKQKQPEDKLIPAQYESEESLLVALVGGYVPGANMLRRIFRWYQYTGEVFFMSYAKWERQAGVTRSMVDTAKKKVFPLIGVTFDVRSASKGREAVTHYRFNPWAFLRRLADVIGISPLKLARRLVENLQDVLQESDKTLTKESINKEIEEVNNESSLSEKKVIDFGSSDVSVTSVLIKHGVYPKVASRYQHMELDTVKAIIAKADGSPGLIVHLLDKEKIAQADAKKFDIATWVNQPAEAAPEPEEVPHNPKFDAMVNEKMSAAEAWREISVRLSGQLGKQYEQIFDRAELVDFDGALVVRLMNQRAVDYTADERLARLINKIIADVCNGVSIRFEAEKIDVPFKFARRESD